MEARAFKPYLIIIVLLILTSVALAFSVNVTISHEAGVDIDRGLPAQVGSWTGDGLLFCQNPECQKTFLVSKLENTETCEACEGELKTISFSEWRVLPKDTTILKKQYMNNIGDKIFVSIVLSGENRSSIHRPQMCLTGQGQTIVRSNIFDIPMEEPRDDLGVMVLDLHRDWKGPDGSLRNFTSYYAYWFVGKDRETPSHLQRMIWMAMDKVVFNRTHRWAYIAVSGMREDGSEEYRNEISSFVHDLYPQITLN